MDQNSELKTFFSKTLPEIRKLIYSPVYVIILCLTVAIVYLFCQETNNKTNADFVLKTVNEIFGRDILNGSNPVITSSNDVAKFPEYS